MKNTNSAKTTIQPSDKSQAESPSTAEQSEQSSSSPQLDNSTQSIEIGGRKGPEPTRFGDWEKNGRCIDF